VTKLSCYDQRYPAYSHKCDSPNLLWVGLKNRVKQLQKVKTYCQAQINSTSPPEPQPKKTGTPSKRDSPTDPAPWKHREIQSSSDSPAIRCNQHFSYRLAALEPTGPSKAEAHAPDPGLTRGKSQKPHLLPAATRTKRKPQKRAAHWGKVGQNERHIRR
jgi:hypothetical protein